MPGFTITDPEQAAAARRLHEYMKGYATTSSLTQRKVPEGLGFRLGPDGKYCVAMGSIMFLVRSDKGRDPDRLCITLEREYVQLKIDFSAEPIKVVVRELGEPSQLHAQFRRSVSYAHASV